MAASQQIQLNIRPFFFIGDKDCTWLQNIDLILPYSILTRSNNEPALIWDDRVLTKEEIWLYGLAGVALSSESLLAFNLLEQHYKQWFDAPLPPILDLTTSNDINKITPFLVEQLAQAQQKFAIRNSQLTKQLAELRKLHDQTQIAFFNLEKFIYNGNLAKRTLVKTLSPSTLHEPLMLKNGDKLIQRLPDSLAGLSDFSIHISTPPKIKNGNLNILLSTMEEEETIAVWQVAAEDIKIGWLQLSLPIAMGSEGLTPKIALNWNGESSLMLSVSLMHPDVRYQASINDKPSGYTLTLKTWTYPANCEAQILEGTCLPVNAPVPQRKLISSQKLSTAVCLTAGMSNEHFNYNTDYDVLMIHVMPNVDTAGFLPAAIPSGTTNVNCKIKTLSTAGPEIEYAIAVGDTNRRHGKIIQGSHFDFADMHHTDWQLLPPMENGELHLFFTESLAKEHDLYLITRLPKGKNDNSYGYSTFGSIIISK